ncbi:MAG TPA: hypothetical protein VE684_08335 [Crenalkalicoccus sp.]|jgi:hypothetical protein|nr:hypothetical protein [Crenalkalicoccus sp.]
MPALILAAATAAALPTPAPASLAEALPREAAGFVRGSATDFATRPGGEAGLGIGVEYRPVTGAAGVATVYLYDRRRADLPPGAESPAVRAELDTAQREIETLGPDRGYRIAARWAIAPLVGLDGVPALSCLRMVLAYISGLQADSFACVGVVQGRFVKLRMTLPAAQDGSAEQQLREFGVAVVTAAERAPSG